MATFDDLRAAYPRTGFAVYAYAPGEPVTIEAHTEDGQVLAMTHPTLAGCLAVLLPSPEPEKELGLFD